MLKLLPTPVPSSTGGTGMGSRHFLSRGVAPTTAGAAAANDARLTTSPTPPIAPRCTSCRLVNITPSLRAARKQAQRRRDIAECAAVQSMGLFVRNTMAAHRRTRIGNRPRAACGQLRTFGRNRPYRTGCLGREQLPYVSGGPKAMRKGRTAHPRERNSTIRHLQAKVEAAGIELAFSAVGG